jgi:hypothetical protein
LCVFVRRLKITVNGHDNLLLHRRQGLDAAKPAVIFIHGVLNDRLLQTCYLANHGWNAGAGSAGHSRRSGDHPPRSKPLPVLCWR